MHHIVIKSFNIQEVCIVYVMKIDRYIHWCVQPLYEEKFCQMHWCKIFLRRIKATGRRMHQRSYAQNSAPNCKDGELESLSSCCNGEAFKLQPTTSLLAAGKFGGKPPGRCTSRGFIPIAFDVLSSASPRFGVFSWCIPLMKDIELIVHPRVRLSITVTMPLHW